MSKETTPRGRGFDATSYKGAGVIALKNIKLESRNPKFETISNDQNPNDRNCTARHSISRMQIDVFVSDIGTL
jgi:hypothetical protein